MTGLRLESGVHTHGRFNSIRLQHKSSQRKYRTKTGALTSEKGKWSRDRGWERQTGTFWKTRFYSWRLFGSPSGQRWVSRFRCLPRQTGSALSIALRGPRYTDRSLVEGVAVFVPSTDFVLSFGVLPLWTRHTREVLILRAVAAALQSTHGCTHVHAVTTEIATSRTKTGQY